MTHPEEPPAAALAADWITIWHSEWAALASDREVQEAWQRVAASRATPASAAESRRAPADAAARPTWPASPARTSAAADAPDARDAVIADLLDRVARLERRAAAAPPTAADPERA